MTELSEKVNELYLSNAIGDEMKAAGFGDIIIFNHHLHLAEDSEDSISDDDDSSGNISLTED